MSKTQSKPQKIADETLETVSGGPHFKTWNGDIYSYSTTDRLTKVASQQTRQSQAG